VTAPAAPTAGPARLDDALERLTVFIAATGLSGLALALCERFTAPYALGAGLLATLLYHLRFPLAPRRDAGARAAGLALGVGALRWWQLVPVLLLALALRVPAGDASLGGQDQGVYAHVAAQIVRTGGIAVHDPAYARLAATPAREAYVADNFIDPFEPGVYTIPGDPPGFVFQFYHLFPVWLALFGGLFGMGASGGGLVLLALVSVLFFQRLAHALTGHAGVAVAAGTLLAVNPLHAIFSKFPVSEVPTLAFAAMGFAWLARYAQGEAADRRGRWLVLSALAFACLFLTRLSGFMYLPLLFAIAWLARPLDPDAARGRALSRWALCTIGLYALSVAYGLTWTRPYALKLYDITFSLVGGAHWPIVLAAGVAAAALLTVALQRLPAAGAGAARLRDAVARLERWMGPVLLLLLAAGAWKLYRLGFSDIHAGEPWFAQFPGLAGAGWASVAHGSLVVVALYACPLVFLAYVVLAQRRWQAAGARLALLFLLCFTGYAALLNWNVPYQPFYARYFASELVPALLLFVTCAWAWVASPRGRVALAAVILVSGVYGLAWTLAGVGLRDGAGAHASLARLAAIAGDDDVLLLDAAAGQGVLPGQLKPALTHLFGRNVVTAGEATLGDVSVLEALDAAYADVYLVTGSTRPPPGFVPVAVLPLRILGYPRQSAPPSRVVPVLDERLSVYRMAAAAFTPGRRLTVHAGRDPRVAQEVGRRTPAGLAADGRAGWLATGPRAPLPAGTYVLRVSGRASAPGASVAVTAAAGAAILAAAPIGPADGDGVVAATVFRVPPGNVADLEVRIRVPARTPLAIDGYTITRLR
jgi:hypothetical protein